MQTSFSLILSLESESRFGLEKQLGTLHRKQRRAGWFSGARHNGACSRLLENTTVMNMINQVQHLCGLRHRAYSATEGLCGTPGILYSILPSITASLHGDVTQMVKQNSQIWQNCLHWWSWTTEVCLVAQHQVLIPILKVVPSLYKCRLFGWQRFSGFTLHFTAHENLFMRCKPFHPAPKQLIEGRRKKKDQ